MKVSTTEVEMTSSDRALIESREEAVSATVDLCVASDSVRSMLLPKAAAALFTSGTNGVGSKVARAMIVRPSLCR